MELWIREFDCLIMLGSVLWYEFWVKGCLYFFVIGFKKVNCMIVLDCILDFGKVFFDINFLLVNNIKVGI